MIKTRQNKSILYLLAVALMVAIMSIACKNKPTAAGDFVDEPEVANPTETLTPTGELPINKASGPSQYDNKKFVSKKYKDSGIEFRYEIKITKLTTENQGTSLTFTGYKDGKQFSREYIFPGWTAGKGDSYGFPGGNGPLILKNGSGSQTAKVKFYNIDNKGWASFQPSDYNFTLELALTNQ